MKRALAAILVLWAGPVWAEDETELLIKAKRGVDSQAAGGGSEEQRAESLAQQYEVEPPTVEKMRNRRLGWGEISTQLAIARQLSLSDPGRYPTVAGALSRVESLRWRGLGYGQVARELGVKLTPVIREVERSRETIQAARRVEQRATA